MTARRTAPAVRQLNQRDIVDTALRLCRKIGGDNLSMRKLAAELGVTPMAIYYHVSSKEELLDLLVDAVLATVPMPAPRADRWQEQLKACAITSFELLNAYPDLSRIMLSRLNTKSGQALVGYGISILLAAGFDEQEAARATAAFNTYLFGAYAATNAYSQVAKRGPKRAANRRNAEASATGIGAVARHLRDLRAVESLDYGLEVLLNGIAEAHERRAGVRQG